jgi:hypothetical protein
MFKYLTCSTKFHLLLPVFLVDALTERAADKPAKFAAFKFPGRALFFTLGRAIFYSPAVFLFNRVGPDSGKQKKELPFDRDGNGSPTLFIAVDCLKGYPQQLRHLFLGFV